MKYILLCSMLILAGCGALVTAEVPPLPTPQVIRQVVTTIVIQTQIVTATPQPATPTPKAKPTAPPKPTATPNPAGKWTVLNKTSSFDDSTGVTLALDAENDISGPIGPVRPTLYVRCKEHAKDVFIHTDLQPDVESGNLDGATIRVRFDSDQAQTLNADKSTDGKALFFPEADPYIDAMLKHGRMVFGFTPYGVPPQEMTFDLHGLSEIIGPLNEACK